MLAAVMVVCMIPISAANAVMISIGSAELVVGETIELPVTVSSDVAIGSFDAQVVYDSSYLSLTKVKTGDLNGIIMGGNKINWVTATDDATNGTICLLVFKV